MSTLQFSPSIPRAIAVCVCVPVTSNTDTVAHIDSARDPLAIFAWVLQSGTNRNASCFTVIKGSPLLGLKRKQEKIEIRDNPVTSNSRGKKKAAQAGLCTHIHIHTSHSWQNIFDRLPVIRSCKTWNDGVRIHLFFLLVVVVVFYLTCKVNPTRWPNNSVSWSAISLVALCCFVSIS